MGQRNGFSRSDLLKINQMYRCDTTVGSETPNFETVSKPSGGGGGGNGFNQAVGGFISGLGSIFSALGGGGKHDENENNNIEFEISD